MKKAKKKQSQKFDIIKKWVSCSSIGGEKGDGYSVGKDKDGYFAFTHRARSKSYPTEKDIPVKDRLFIGSTA